MTRSRQRFTETPPVPNREQIELDQLLVRQPGVVHDFSEGDLDGHFVVMCGTRLADDLVRHGTANPVYSDALSEVVVQGHEEASERARFIASVPLEQVTDGTAPAGFPLTREEYHPLARTLSGRPGGIMPDIYSSAIVTDISPNWGRVHEDGYSLMLREGITPEALRALGGLVGTTLGEITPDAQG